MRLPTPESRRRYPLAVAGVLVLIALVWWPRGDHAPSADHSGIPAVAPAAPGTASVATAPMPPAVRAAAPPLATPLPPSLPAAVSDVSFGALREWITAYHGLPVAVTNRAEVIARGVALAAARKVQMARLIREEPELAIRESLSFADHAALPAAVQALVEQPFSVVADFHYYPVCPPSGGRRAPAGTPDYVADLSLADGTRLEAFVYGHRAEVMTKRAVPVQGIALAGAAAVRDGVFQKLSAADLVAVQARFPAAQPGAARSFVTGRALPGAASPVDSATAVPAVHALAGGRLHTFASETEFQQFDHALAQLDALPGPHASSGVLNRPAFSATDTAGFNLPAAQAYAVAQADAWTESPKKLFLIRVDFSDKPGAPVSQAAALAEINGPSSRRLA